MDWNDSGPVGPLARKSYAMHRQLATDLADEVGADVGYREVNTLQVEARAKPRPGARRQSSLPEWIDGNVTGSMTIGTTATTAQVHPGLLTKALLAAAEKGGAVLHKGTVQGVSTSGEPPAITGVLVDGEEVPADAVVIAMGPWSGQATAWLPVPPISGQRAHSAIFRPKEPVSAHCLFTSFTTANGKHKEPEIYPRPDGTVYVCGESDSVPVPPSPAEVSVKPEYISNLQSIAGSFASCLADAELEASQSCYLPLSPDGPPVIGAVPGVKGAYIASGHSCWGILNGPATGLAMAELIVKGKSTSIDISALSPARFARLRSARR